MKRANITTYDVLVTGNFNKNLQNDAIEVRTFIAQLTQAFLCLVHCVVKTERDHLREQSVDTTWTSCSP